jgi:hypothetical protein
VSHPAIPRALTDVAQFDAVRDAKARDQAGLCDAVCGD